MVLLKVHVFHFWCFSCDKVLAFLFEVPVCKLQFTLLLVYCRRKRSEMLCVGGIDRFFVGVCTLIKEIIAESCSFSIFVISFL